MTFPADFRRRFAPTGSRFAEALSLAQNWRSADAGNALNEFAIVFPIAMMLIALMMTFAQGLEVSQKTYETAQAVTNLVSQQIGQVSQNEINCIVQAGNAIVSPWPSSNLTVVVSGIQIDNQGGATGTVLWSVASNNGAPLAVGSTVNIANGSLPQGSFQVLGQASYAYTPMGILSSFVSTYTLNDQVYMSTRSGNPIQVTSN